MIHEILAEPIGMLAVVPTGVVPLNCISALFAVAVVVTGTVYVKVDFAGAPVKVIIVFAGTPTIAVPDDKLKLNVIYDAFVAGVNVTVTLKVTNNVPNGNAVPVVNRSVNVFAETLTIAVLDTEFV